MKSFLFRSSSLTSGDSGQLSGSKLSLAVASKLHGDPTKDEGSSRKVTMTMTILTMMMAMTTTLTMTMITLMAVAYKLQGDANTGGRKVMLI